MGKRIIKGKQFYFDWPGESGADVYENCDFHSTYLFFNNDHTNLVFKNCNFITYTSFNFVIFRGKVRFKNCRFTESIKFTGSIFKKGRIKFTKCEGLDDLKFYDLKNNSQTLSEMGLYRIFKDRILSTRKEETVYKKIGIFTVYGFGLVHVGSAVATLTIPKGVIRYGDRRDKCRCEKAVVTSIFPLRLLDDTLEQRFQEHPNLFKYASIRDNSTVYEVGKEVKPNYFDYIPNKCSYGIHYFYDRELAEDYDFH